MKLLSETVLVVFFIRKRDALEEFRRAFFDAYNLFRCDVHSDLFPSVQLSS